MDKYHLFKEIWAFIATLVNVKYVAPRHDCRLIQPPFQQYLSSFCLVLTVATHFMLIQGSDGFHLRAVFHFYKTTLAVIMLFMYATKYKYTRV